MSKMIQIRNVPDDLHRKLKARAAKLGMSLSDYLLDELRRAAEKPTLQEWLERTERRPPLDVTDEQIVGWVREGREER